jgi:hypothetical protein
MTAMAVSDYLGILTAPEIQTLRKTAKNGARHPVAALALAKPPSQVAINTERAARQIAQKDLPWLSALKPRLIDQSDFTNASSALGEIRAYGALLKTAMAVKTKPAVLGKKVVPEFEANAGDGAVIVEVHSRQLDPAQAQAISEHQKRHRAEHRIAVEEAKTAGEDGVITSAAIGVIPLGAPNRNKKGDSVLTNAISRICRIKEDEKQIDPAKPFVLWLDLQDPLVWGASIAEQQLAPLYTESKDGAVGTGALWFALYGRKGDPMIETEGFTYRVRNMLHDGRFCQIMKAHGGPTRVSAVVYSMPRATVLMENPLENSSTLPLPPHFRAGLLKTPFFCLDRSICEWQPGLAKARIKMDRDIVEAAAKALLAFNARLE